MNPYEEAWKRLEAILDDVKTTLGCDPDGEAIVAKLEVVEAFLEGARLSAPKDPWLEGYKLLSAAIDEVMLDADPSDGHLNNLASDHFAADKVVTALGGDISLLAEEDDQ